MIFAVKANPYVKHVIVLLVLMLLPLGLWAAPSSITIVQTPTVLDPKGGAMTFTVSLEHDVSVTGVGVGLVTPSAQWTFSSASGANPPDVKPAVGETGFKGEGLGFFYLETPPTLASFTVTLKYPAGIKDVQTFKLQGMFVKSSGVQDTVTASTSLSQTPITVTAPRIASEPSDYTGKVGDTVKLSVGAASDAAATYQWYKDSIAISGATSSSYSISSLQDGDVGIYSVKVTNIAGSVTSRNTKVGFGTTGYISALSIRTNAGAGDQTLIIGLVVASGGTGANKSVLGRAVGPSLSRIDASLTNLLPDPIITVYSASGATLASNDNWGGTADLRSAFTATSVSPLEATSKDAALLSSLPVGAYTVHVTDAAGKSGLALVELYDTGAAGGNSSRLSAVSARATAGAAQNVLIAGFIISGESGKKLLIRGMGPALAKDGISNYLTDPLLTVYDGTGKIVTTNDNWGASAELKSAFLAIGSGLPSDDSKDAALVVTLPPGGYSVQVSGSGESQGVALVDIWEIP